MRAIIEITPEKIKQEAQYLQAILEQCAAQVRYPELLLERLVRDIAYGFMVEGLPEDSRVVPITVVSKSDPTKAWVVYAPKAPSGKPVINLNDFDLKDAPDSING